VANGNQDWFQKALMSYTQFSCSDFLKVLFQEQADTEFKEKNNKAEDT